MSKQLKAKRASMRAHASSRATVGDCTLPPSLRSPGLLTRSPSGASAATRCIRRVRRSPPISSRACREPTGESCSIRSNRSQRAWTWRRILQAVLGIGPAVVLIVWGLSALRQDPWADIWSSIQVVPWWHVLAFQG